MKLAPLSSDLVLKLALYAAAIGAVLYIARGAGQQLQNTAGAAADWAANLARTSLNPASDQNVAYQGANAVVSAATGRDETLGGWLFGATHPDPVASPRPADPGFDPMAGIDPYSTIFN